MSPTALLSRADLDLVARIEARPLQNAPFDHLYLEDVFPPASYDTLLDHLPETRRYRELTHREAMQADGRSARRKFYLFPEQIILLPAAQRAVWLEVSRALRSPALQNAFKHKFRDALERRLGRSIDHLSFYPVPMLLRDFGGYRIGIHCDSIGKAITAQFYLPRDDAQAHMGTILHEARDGEAALRTKTMQFRPATGYAFPVVFRESWHSVARTSAADGVRNSLMLTYYVEENPGRWLVNRVKRFWTLLAYGLRR